jgi:GNAT superfamily N-acetyltransferase
MNSTLLTDEQREIAIRIARLHATSWKTAYRGLFDEAYLDHHVESERRHHWLSRVPKLFASTGEIFVATLGEEDVGFVCVERKPEDEWGVYVDNLHVLPGERGSGLGIALLARAAVWAREHGATQLYLLVYEDNVQARHFYQREGWHTMAREVNAAPDGGRYPCLRLVKSV